jgi:glycosyltransferase involved in cell wall biosynthesis
LAACVFFLQPGDDGVNVLVVQRQSLVAGVDFSLSVYARIIEAMDWLRDHGMIQYACCAEGEEAVFGALKWADAVIFNKHFSERAIAIAKAARNAGCVTLLDLDDLVTAFPSYSGGMATKQQNRFAEMLDLMDRVTVANGRLLEAIQPVRSDSVLVPNGIYVEKYPEPVLEEAYPPRCVFTNADYLKIQVFKHDFIGLLQDFHDTHPEVAIDFFGDPFPELTSLPFIHYTWRIPYTEYIHCLARNGYCFAITPLGTKEDAQSLVFNRCKNPFKFLNYGIAGIPCIYSASEIYTDCIDHGHTGLLVKNTRHAWRDAMDTLFGDAQLRSTIRNNSYRTVCDMHHIEKAANLYYILLNGEAHKN